MSEFTVYATSSVGVLPAELDRGIAKVGSDVVRVHRSGFDAKRNVELELRVEAASEDDARRLAMEALGRWLSGSGAGWQLDIQPPAEWAP